MSEQLPIDGLQFAAQLAPQALNSTVPDNATAAADFRKFLLEQQLTASGGLQTGTLTTDELAGESLPLPVNAPNLLQVVNPQDGKALPQGGNLLQQQAGKPLPGALLPSQAVRASDLIQSEPITEETILSAGSNKAVEGQVAERANLTVASRALQASLTSSPAASATNTALPDDSLAVNTVIQQEPGGPDKFLQSLLGNQQASIRATEGQVENSRSQAVQQVVNNLAQPQASAVTYSAVAQPQTTPPPAESGLLSSQSLQTFNIDVPVQNADWSRAFAERAVWLVNNQQSAQLRLTPANMGQIDIQVKVQDDEASIIFNTQNNAVRETVEASLPRLRDMLESQGLNLVDVDVNEGNTSSEDGFTSAFDDAELADGEEQQAEPATMGMSSPMLMSSAALDLYV